MFLLIFTPILFLSSFSPAQELHIGLGTTLTEYSTGTPYIDLDSVVIYEDNRNKGWGRLIPTIYYLQNITSKFSMKVGFQYRLTAMDLSAYQKTEHPLGPASKGNLASLPTFEFPLTASYRIIQKRKMKLNVMGGIMPVVNKINSKDDYTAEPSSLDWTQPVADALNQAGALPKSTYVNYHYGFTIAYQKFGVDVYWQHNITRSLTKPLELYGKKFEFQRRTRSFRFALYYRIWSK